MTLMDDPPPSAAHVIAALRLEPHPEGGFFRETFRAVELVEAAHGRRARATSIAFLLTVDGPSRFHRLLSAELWVHQAGAPLELSVLESGGAAYSVLLGALGRGRASRDASAGARAGARLAGGSGRSGGRCPRSLRRRSLRRPPRRSLVGGPAAAVAPGEAARSSPDWSLVTCVVTPGFEYTDFELGRADVLRAGWPQAGALIAD